MIRRFVDGLQNAITGLGTRADARTSRAYAANLLTQPQIEAAYRGSGMLRKAIDIPALDMVREWRDWQAEADQISAIEAEERRLSIQAKVRQAEVLRGLGGGALILGVPGDPALPVNVNALGKQSIAFIHVVSRWQLTLGDMVEDPADPLFGGPRFFSIQSDGQQRRIHPSRVICFKGEPLPSIIATGAEDLFWGEGRVQRVLDAAMNLDEVLASFAALIKDARNIDIGVSKLLEVVATADGEAALMKRLQVMVQGSSILGANLYDKGDAEGKGGEEIKRHQLTWAGIPEIIRVNAEALAAASDIPMTRLWGKAAEGMNASGDSQQRDWAKMVMARQNLDLRPCLDQLDPLLVRSAGVDPAKVWFKFAPLDTPSEKDEADRFKVTMDAVAAVQNTGAIPDVAFTKALQNTLTENGWMPGLEGALAELSEDGRFGAAIEPDEEDPSALEGEPPRRRAANDGKGGGRKAKLPFADGKRRRGRHGGNYRESDHPRGSHGRWTNTNSGKILQHASRALGSGKEHSTTSLGQVSDANAAKVLKQTGVSIAGHERIVQSSDIRHTIRSHGDPATEAARGQVAIGKQDFTQIPRIVESAHTIRAIGEPGARKHQRLEYVANLDGHEYRYVEEVRPNKIVALKSMLKRVEGGARGE